MTQMTIWLDNDANPAVIKKVLQNIKWVMKISLHKKKDKKEEVKAREWINELHRLVNNVDRSVIDMNDERTRYIMSK